jgi:hypothetical protein
MKISRLGNGRVRPNRADIMKILDAPAVTGRRWSELTDTTHEVLDEIAIRRPPTLPPVTRPEPG